VEVKEQYQVCRNGNLDDDVDMNRVWLSTGENIKDSTTDSLSDELKQHKPLFNEECSKLLDKKKQAKLQWLQNQTSGNNLNNVRHETSKTFRNK
jgi:hypothetical protein